MRKLLLDAVVAVGTPLVTVDFSAEAFNVFVIPVSGGTVLCESFNVRDGNGVPVDLQTMTAVDASAMSAVASAHSIAKRSALITPPACTGFKFTASTQNCRVVIYGTGI